MNRLFWIVGVTFFILPLANVHSQTSQPIVKKPVEPASKPVKKTISFVKETVLQGTLLGADGKLMERAHVKIERFQQGGDRQWKRVDAKGQWQLKVSKPGMYVLTLSGVSHRPHKISFLLPRRPLIQVNVRLGTLSPRKKISRVRAVVYSAKADDRSRSYYTMKKQKDGSYTASFSSNSASVPFRIVGLSQRGGAVSLSKDVVYHPTSGLYRAVAQAKNGKVFLQVKPKDLLLSGLKPKVDVSPAQAFALHRWIRDFNKERRKAYKAYRAYRKKNKKSWNYKHDWSKFFAQADQEASKTTDVAVQYALTMLKMKMPWQGRHGFRQSRKQATALVDSLPPDSPLWSLGHGSLRSLMNRSKYQEKDAFYQSYVARFLASHPNPMTRMQYVRSLFSYQVFKQRHYGRRFKKYKHILVKEDRGFNAQVKQLLLQHRGKVLNTSLQRELSSQITILMRQHHLHLGKAKSLKRFQSSFVRRRMLKLHNDPKHYIKQANKYFEQMKAIVVTHPTPRMKRMLKYARWKMHERFQRGTEIPTFEVPLLDQPKKTWTTKRFLGHHTLLVFWATWCGPCVRKLPKLHKVHKQYKSKGLQIVSVSIDRDIDAVRQFRKKKWKMPWYNVVLQGKKRKAVQEMFQVASIPRMFLVGPKGKVVASNRMLRGRQWTSLLKKYLGEPAPLPRTVKPSTQPTLKPTPRPTSKPTTSR